MGARNAKIQRFIHEYPKDLNGKQAAIRAGYSPKTAEVQASQLLRQLKVKRAVQKLVDAQLKRADLSAGRVLEEMRRLAFFDIRRLYDAFGHLKPIHTLSEEDAAAIAGFETVIKNAKAGDGITDEVLKVKTHNKPQVLELLAKHFKLLTEIVQLEVSEEQMKILDEGRRVNAERRQLQEEGTMAPLKLVGGSQSQK